MKNNYILIIILLLAGALASCNKDVEGTLYDKGEIQDVTGNVVPEGVTFQAASFNHAMAKADDGKILVPILRSNEEITNVKVAFSNTYKVDVDKSGKDVVEKRLENTYEAQDGNVFTIATPTVTFKSGELTAMVEITYESVENMDPTKAYSTSLVITEGTASVSGFVETSMVVSRKLTFEEIGMGFFAGPFGNFYHDDTLTKYPSGNVPIAIEKAKEGNIFRLVNPFGKLNPDNKGGDFVFVVQNETTAEGFHKISYTSFSTGYGDDDIIWAHFIEREHLDYCYYVPAGELDDIHKPLSYKDRNMMGFVGRFMNEKQGSGYKPGDPVCPDAWAWEFSVIMPNDYVYAAN